MRTPEEKKQHALYMAEWKRKQIELMAKGLLPPKVCVACHELKPADDFYPATYRCKPCHKEYSTSWRKRNPQKAWVSHLKSIRKHAAKRYRQTAAWKKRNAAVNASHTRAYTARMREAAGHSTELQLAERSAMYGDCCWLCGASDAPIMDHVKPLKHGGSNWPANRRPICGSCNSVKGDKWPFTQETYEKIISV